MTDTETLISVDDIKSEWASRGIVIARARIAQAMRRGEHFVINRSLHVKRERIDAMLLEITKKEAKPWKQPHSASSEGSGKKRTRLSGTLATLT